MHYSAILVRSRPGEAGCCARELAKLEQVEVHHTDPASGKLVAVLETRTLDGQQQLLKRIQAHPRVLLAGLVYHYFDAQTTGGREDAAPYGR